MPAGLTPLQVCNRALTEIAQGETLTGGTVSTNFDGTPEGIYCATLYTGAVLTLLRQQDFEFCRRSGIELFSTSNRPPPPWAVEYGYPDDCIRVRQVVPFNLDPFDPQPVRWEVGDVSFSGVILTTFIAFNGANYVAGDTGFIEGTAGTPASYIVNTVGVGGSVLTLTVNNPGSGYPTGNATTLSGGGQPGIGTGLVIDITATTFSTEHVIWTNQEFATLTYSTSLINENDWDSVFAEQMVRYLGSMLAMPVAGRPDFSKEMLDIAGKIGFAGVDKDS